MRPQTTSDPSDLSNPLLKKLTYYRRLSLVLGACLILVTVTAGYFWVYPMLEKVRIDHLLDDSAPPPHYDEIMRLMEPLEYSGFKSLQRKDVRIMLDFRTKAWAILNYHDFDPNGQIVLHNGREGLCGQLADFTSRQIRPILGDRFTIEFVRAAEYGYFLDTQSSHYVLKLTERATGKIFYCDPTFKRYGSPSEFKDYLFSEVLPELAFIKRRDPHFKAKAGFAVPIQIRRGFLIGILVDEVAGKFDKENFALAITCTQQYKFSGRRVFVLRMYHGKPQMNESLSLAEWLLDPADYAEIKKQMYEWFRELSGVQSLPLTSS